MKNNLNLLFGLFLILSIGCKKETINDRFDEIIESNKHQNNITNTLDSNQLILQKIRDVYDLQKMKINPSVDAEIKQEIDSTLVKMVKNIDSIEINNQATLDSLSVINYIKKDSIINKTVRFKENTDEKFAEVQIQKEKIELDGKEVEKVQIIINKIFSKTKN